VSAVAVFVRAWKADRQCAPTNKLVAGHLLPLSFSRGAFQFDCERRLAVIGGETLKLQVAHIKLCHTDRGILVRAYLFTDAEMLFDAHLACLSLCSWHPSDGIYDNIKTAVTVSDAASSRDCECAFFGCRLNRWTQHLLIFGRDGVLCMEVLSQDLIILASSALEIWIVSAGSR